MNFVVAAATVYGAYLIGRTDVPAGALLLAAAALALATRMDALQRIADDDTPTPSTPRPDAPCGNCPDNLGEHPPDGPCSLCPCPGWTPRKDNP